MYRFTFPFFMSFTETRIYNKHHIVRLKGLLSFSGHNPIPEFTTIVIFYKLGALDLIDVYRSKTLEVFIMAGLRDWNLINIKLSEADKRPFDDFVTKNELTILEVAEEIAVRGYKVSISWIDKQNAWCVAVSGSDRSKRNAKSTITSWSSDLDECLLMSLYKIVVVCKDGDWKDFEQSRESWG